MRRLRWIGSSLDELSAFPKDVKRAFGYFLRQVQIGATPPSAKPLRQFGAGVFELRDAYQGDAYRAVYVLHAFKKKSTKGIGLPKPDVALIEDRLKRAQAIDAANGD